VAREQQGSVDESIEVQRETSDSLGLNLCYIVPLGDLGWEALEREGGGEG
jgi:hypothetical protein